MKKMNHILFRPTRLLILSYWHLLCWATTVLGTETIRTNAA